MGTFTPIYSDDQRDAILQAGVAEGLRPIRVICERAAAGTLLLKGEPVPAFNVPESTVAGIVRTATRKREGKAPSKLAELPTGDAIESLRRRLVNAADAQLAATEKAISRSKGAKATAAQCEELRQIARAVREIAAIPGPKGEPATARPPGATIPGETKNDGGPTRGGLAGSILKAAAPRGIPATATPHLEHHTSDTGDHDATPTGNTPPDVYTQPVSDDPGEYVRGQIAAGLTADVVRVRPA